MVLIFHSFKGSEDLVLTSVRRASQVDYVAEVRSVEHLCAIYCLHDEQCTKEILHFS